MFMYESMGVYETPIYEKLLVFHTPCVQNNTDLATDNRTRCM